MVGKGVSKSQLVRVDSEAPQFVRQLSAGESYAQTVSEEAIAAQGRHLEALGQNLGQALLPEKPASAVESTAVGA